MKTGTLEKIITHMLVMRKHNFNTIVKYWMKKTGQSIPVSSDYVTRLMTYLAIPKTSLPKNDNSLLEPSKAGDNQSTYRSKQDLWVSTIELKDGDRVKLLPYNSSDSKCGFPHTINSSMIERINGSMILTVNSIKGNVGILLSDGCTWPYYLLEKVE